MAQDNIEWSSDQMIENASNWSLSGDIALLNSLKNFSQGLLSDTESLNSKVDNLLNNLENVGLKLELTRNEFQSLRNTQFIENRVYEDDETLEGEEQKIIEKELTEEDKENSIKRAISNGLKVMEKYYDKVEVAVSDSEGEGNEKNYVLHPKDPYADRPLPYLVGTQDWYKKSHVGLLPSDSDTESEKEEEEVYSSSSDSEENLPKNRPVGSETSSELSFAIKNSEPVANSTFNDTSDRSREVFHSSEESLDQSSSVPFKTPTSHANFAEQLAAKLGDVVSAKHDSSGNNSQASKQIRSKPAKQGNLFSDEPPPLDDLEDTILPKSAHEGLFSGSRDLFAENNQDDLFWGLPQDKPNSNIQKPSQLPGTLLNKKMPKGLFDSSDSEDDMVAVTEKRKILSNTHSSRYMVPSKATAVPFVDEQPPEIEAKKKPVGGVSVFGTNVDIFSNKSTISQKQQGDKLSATIKKTGLFDESSEDEMFIEKGKIAAKEKQTKLSLFDDSDDSTKNNKSDDRATKKEVTKKVQEVKKISLFDDEDGEDTVDVTSKGVNETVTKSTSIFDNDRPKVAETKKLPKKVSLFDDDDDDFLKEEEDIFAFVPKKRISFDELEKTTTSRSTKSLFDDDNLEGSKKHKSLFDKEEKEKESQDKHIGLKKDNSSLFDEDILEGIKNETSILDKEIENRSLHKKIDVKKDTKTETKTLFNEDVSEENQSKTSLVDKEEKQFVEEIPNKEVDVKNNPISLLHEDLTSDDGMFVTPKILEGVEKLEPKDHEASQTEESNVQDSKHEKNSSESHPALEKKSNEIGLEGANEKSPEEGNIIVPQIIKSEKEKITKHEPSEPPPVPQSFSIPPLIDLFDPTPPPVDWDASSDNSGESDTFSLTDGILDRTSYNQSQPSSNLFDEAPPRWDVHDLNYSSGIARDLNVTRVEADDSSFNPHASSSRRLSSDIFNEQQSQDSFFVTKNHTENAQTSNLQKIAETPDESISKIENLTPSGNLEDLEGSSVFEKVSSDMNTTDAIDKPAKVADFGSEGNEQRENDNNPGLPKIKTSPGKLKHNLNINVGALLPGAAPPKTRPIVNKSVSLDETDKSANLPSSEGFLIPKPLTRPKSELFDASRLIEASASKSEVGETEVLESVTKDRARIQVKRRPSTRKARQEWAKKSMEDFYSIPEPILSNKSLSPKLEAAQQPNDTYNKNADLDNSCRGSTPSEFIEKPKTDENDTLSSNKPSKPTYVDSDTKNENRSSSVKPPTGISLVFDKQDNKKDLFDISKDDLFGSVSRPAATSLFDDFYEKNDIFNSSLKKDETKPKVEEPKTDGSKLESPKDIFPDIFKSNKKLPGIFDEEDFPSDEDLFFNKTETSSMTAKKLQDNQDELFSSPKFEKVSASVAIENKDLSSTVENVFSASVTTTTKTENLFARDSKDLFSPSDAKKTTSEKKLPKKNIFLESDSESDSELFGATSKTDNKKVAGKSKNNTNLFDSGDSTDDDDLFGAKTSQSSTTAFNKVAPIKKMEIKTANIKKLENREITDFDPLSGCR
ncbi:unnamed protein product [Ceutorhynchus assimilis]|uniref:FAM21/CAPZIP domain-containing protein n=1 Tax=Ceutorhynchus assimilis TaxID=467358 RepID=A0A9N9QQM3_9CUCU|nr:unnamed protein product [Ceutorhynchus assimilis]